MATKRRYSLGWYRALLKLYPKSYRQRYASEMLHTLEDMYASTSSRWAKFTLIVRALTDYVCSLSQQSIGATESSFSDAPAPVKRDAALGSTLIAPFFLIFIYNITSLYFHHSVAFVRIEVHTWTVYTFLLPILAVALSVKICLGGTYAYLLRHEWRQALHSFFHEWLFLGIVIGALAIAAIF